MTIEFSMSKNIHCDLLSPNMISLSQVPSNYTSNVCDGIHNTPIEQGDALVVEVRVDAGTVAAIAIQQQGRNALWLINFLSTGS